MLHVSMIGLHLSPCRVDVDPCHSQDASITLRECRIGSSCAPQRIKGRRVYSRSTRSAAVILPEDQQLAQSSRHLCVIPMSVLVLVGFILLTAPASAQTGVAVPEMSSLDAGIQAFMNKWNVPGGAVAVSYRGRLVYARGFGYADVVGQIPVEPTNSFRIASVSKSVSGIVAAKLIDEGKIALAEKVFGPSGLLKGPHYDTLADPRMIDITVGDLLYHTAGLGTLSTGHDPVFADLYVESQMGFGLPHSPEDKIEYYLKTQSLRRNPGTGYEYSNLGYLILGRVIEAVTGASYTAYTKTVLFDPLGISTFRMGRSLLADRLPGEVLYYEPAGSGMAISVYGTGEQVPWSYGGMNVETFDSHGGWTASVVDLVRLLDAVDGFSTSPDILSSAAIQLLRTPTAASAGYAMGFAVNAANNWWHMGSIPGASAEWVRASGGFNLALLFNTRSSAQLDQFNREMDAIFWSARNGFSGWPAHDLYPLYTAIEPESVRPGRFSLEVYPNPSRDEATVQISTALASWVTVSVLDILGRNVMRLDSEPAVGTRLISIDTGSLRPGVYFVRTSDGRVTSTARLVVSR